MYFVGNLDLVSVGIAIAGMAILGFAVFFNNRHSITNGSFLIFSFAAIFWSLFNYLYTQPYDPWVILWLLRIHAFFAVWYVYFLFQLFYVFPKSESEFPFWYKILVLLVGFISILTLTPLVFGEITELFPNGTLAKVSNGPGIYFFGSAVTALVVAAAIVLLRKAIKATGLEKRQFDFVLFGATITFSLHIVFNFILPAFFNNPQFISLGATFIFPFVALTAYAIFKHHLLNIKVIATESLTFILTVATIFEVIVSKDSASLILRFSIFLLVLCISILLNRSVRREVEQREQLELLTKELATMNEQLKTLDQARAEFISIASHQLRTPPATIKWYLAGILGGDFGHISARVRSALLKTQSTNSSMISLIDDLLNASRIERGKMEFLFEPVDLAPLVSTTMEQLMPQALEKKLKLTYVKPKKKIPIIAADKEKIRQVINNFIDNAIKYTKTGSITAELELKDKNVLFKVTDTGKGIDPLQTENIFNKYSRGHDAASHATGLGLGLYVAKAVVEQHKGKIWAESPGEGKGSTFIFSLPLRSNLKPSGFWDLSEKKIK